MWRTVIFALRTLLQLPTAEASTPRSRVRGALMDLYLLVRAEGEEQTLTVEGHRLRLTGPYATGAEDNIPPYACVSYVWLSGRLHNPLLPQHLMSDRTLPALGAVIRSVPSSISAFWVDAFCIPYQQPARSATLESMGYIYSAADRVVAALGSEHHDALMEMTRQDWVAEDLLAPFESDGWISSVWTYQEIVNARRHFVTCTALGTPTIDGETFLNRIGDSLQHYKNQRQATSFDVRRSLPHLDAFEDLGGDYMTYSAFERPMLQIMFMLDRRVALEERNKYYTMIGALTAEQTGRNAVAGHGLPALRQKVMDVCVKKGDWSFLYSSTERDQAVPWMPSSQYELRSILPYFVHGSGQSGRVDDEGRVWLEEVAVVKNALAGEQKFDVDAVKNSVVSGPLLRGDSPTATSMDELKALVRDRLTWAGFTGIGRAITIPLSLFYPQAPAPDDTERDLVVCTELKWTFGCPALLVGRAERMTFIPGVLVGALEGDSDAREYMLGSLRLA